MSATARKRLDTIYADEVADWKAVWFDFFEEWDHAYDEVVDLTVEELDVLSGRDDECTPAMQRLIEQWQQSCGWHATPEEKAAWQQFVEGCEAWLSRYVEAEDSGEADLSVWPSDIPTAPDEHEHEGALLEVARREIATGVEQDLRREAAKDVLFALFQARLSRRFAGRAYA